VQSAECEACTVGAAGTDACDFIKDGSFFVAERASFGWLPEREALQASIYIYRSEIDLVHRAERNPNSFCFHHTCPKVRKQVLKKGTVPRSEKPQREGAAEFKSAAYGKGRKATTATSLRRTKNEGSSRASKDGRGRRSMFFDAPGVDYFMLRSTPWPKLGQSCGMRWRGKTG
jgi:hypothetical protein